MVVVGNPNNMITIPSTHHTHLAIRNQHNPMVALNPATVAMAIIDLTHTTPAIMGVVGLATTSSTTTESELSNQVIF